LLGYKVVTSSFTKPLRTPSLTVMMQHVMNTQVDARSLLRQELEKRIEKNPRYSMRAFAKSLGLSHSLLSLVISGKRSVSTAMVQKLVSFLDLDPIEKQSLLSNYKVQKVNNGFHEDQDTFYQMELDTFAVISDWYHYAILSLLEIENSKFEAKWISSKLGISVIQAKLAMERLKRMKLVSLTNGRWKQSVLPIKINPEMTNDATRKFHRQLLERALDALDNVPKNKRDFSTMTFAMDPSLVPYAAKRLRELERELVASLEKKGKPKVVYNLTIQLIPVSSDDVE
jgi:uncharacterized protein (TIGR02147 family)